MRYPGANMPIPVPPPAEGTTKSLREAAWASSSAATPDSAGETAAPVGP